jgi:hypothetical protein
MSEQDLDRLEVCPGLQQMGGKTMAQRVRADPFAETRSEGGSLADSLNRAVGQRRAGFLARKQPTGGPVPSNTCAVVPAV